MTAFVQTAGAHAMDQEAAPAGALRFDRPLTRDGYAWWYVDALSDDGRFGLTVIAFLGSVFSPHYARARRRPGGADPLNHCAMHVALYGPRGARWAMTERGGAAVMRWPAALAIGLSVARWDGQALELAIDELAAPLPRRVRGTVRVLPEALPEHVVRLDAAGRHRWQPIAPRARVEVAFSQPELRWSGPGYLDTNHGDEPLERAFRSWTWSRVPLRRGAAILYDVIRRDGSTQDVALHIGAEGQVAPFEGARRVDLPATFWRLGRHTRADAGVAARVARTLTDAPFYARSELATRLLGEDVAAMHESLSLDRFVSPWVQLMLPFRAPRAWR